MMATKIDALQLALDVWGMERPVSPEYVLLLGRTGVFTPREIADLTDRTPYFVRQTLWGVDTPRYRFGERFDPRCLDSLVLLLTNYQNTGVVNKRLLDLALGGGSTSMTVVSRLTGLGVSELAEADDLL